jgi:hypothetical protein
MVCQSFVNDSGMYLESYIVLTNDHKHLRLPSRATVEDLPHVVVVRGFEE